jgi:hypothetical protein
MPLLECPQRRRRLAPRRRDASLGPEDARAVRRAVSCSCRQSCFLEPHRCLPLALVLVYDSLPCNIRRSGHVRHPLGPLFPRSWLPCRQGEAVAVVSPGEDEFPGWHRDGAVRVERRCVWWLDRGEMAGEWLGGGWMERKWRETSLVSPTFVAHPLFA